MNGIEFKGAFPLGPMSGLMLALSTSIYPIVGRFGMPNGDHHRSAWMHMQRLFEENLKCLTHVGTGLIPLPLHKEWKVVCDASNNPPDYVDQKRICVLLMAHKVGIADEFWVAKAVFGRVEREGRGYLEIEWLPCGNC